MCSRSTCMNTQTFPQSYENTRSEQEVNSSLLSATLACACACVCYSRVLSLLRCPNEWPHPGQGSSQITGQNCRQPAAWVANKCHYNFYKEEGAPKGTDTGQKVERGDVSKKKSLDYNCWWSSTGRETMGVNKKRRQKSAEGEGKYIYTPKKQQQKKPQNNGQQQNNSITLYNWTLLKADQGPHMKTINEWKERKGLKISISRKNVLFGYHDVCYER